jgi:hypothetical protein
MQIRATHRVIVSEGVGERACELAQSEQRETREEHSEDGPIAAEHGVGVGQQQQVDDQDEVLQVEEGKRHRHHHVVLDERDGAAGLEESRGHWISWRI